MKQSPPSNPASLLAAMTSLADDTRLRLLRLLEQHELGVGELGQILQLPQPTVSRHLKTLADAAFVISRREGTSNLYRMRLDELPPSARQLWLVAREHTHHWPELTQDQRRLASLLNEKASSSRAFFAGAAAEWDRLRDELYGPSFSTTATLALLPDTATVADLGCGTGSVAASLSPFVDRVLAVDNSPEMLAAARDRTALLPNVSVLEGELTRLPIEPNSCDAALLLLALTYVADLHPVLLQANHILKPNGKLILVDLLPHGREDFRRKLNQLHPGFPQDMISSALAAAGFPTSRFTPLPTPPTAKGPGLFLAVAHKHA